MRTNIDCDYPPKPASKINIELKYRCDFLDIELHFTSICQKTCSLNRSGRIFGGLFGLLALMQFY